MSQHFLVVFPGIRRVSGIWLLIGASLITLAACSPAASALEPAVTPLVENVSADPRADQQPLQDQPATGNPVPEAGPEIEPGLEPLASIPAPGASDEPEELIQSAVDLALQGDLQGVYRLDRSGDPAYVPVLIDLLRLSWSFPAEETQSTIFAALGEIAQQNSPENFQEFDPQETTGWSWWVKWLGQNPEIKSPPGYAAWKGRLYAQLVDPEMGDFL